MQYYSCYTVCTWGREEEITSITMRIFGAIFGLAATIFLVYVKQPDLFKAILMELKHPSLLGK